MSKEKEGEGSVWERGVEGRRESSRGGLLIAALPMVVVVVVVVVVEAAASAETVLEGLSSVSRASRRGTRSSTCGSLQAVAAGRVAAEGSSCRLRAVMMAELGWYT